MVDALDLYDKHDPNILRTVVGLGSAVDDGQLKSQLSKFAPRWIAAGGPDNVDHRRLVVGSFVLDALTPTAYLGSGMSLDLIKWASGRLRETKTPLPAERYWHLAAIELLENYGDPDALETELGHARERFPDEPRFLLASAWLEEAMRTTPRPSSIVEGYWDLDSPGSGSSYGHGSSGHGSSNSRSNQAGYSFGSPRLGSSTPNGRTLTTVRAQPVFGNLSMVPIGIASPGNPDLTSPRSVWTNPDAKARVANGVINKYARAAAVPALAPEATLRLGYLNLVSGKPEVALTSFTRMPALTSQHEFLYLAYLFSGWSAERLHHLGDAEAAYRHALEQIPAARTATTALAETLQAEGKLDEAQASIDAVLARPSKEADPWLRFGQSDLFSVPNLAAQLRTSWQ